MNKILFTIIQQGPPIREIVEPETLALEIVLLMTLLPLGLLWASIKLRSIVSIVAWLAMIFMLVFGLLFQDTLIYFWIGLILNVMAIAVSLTVGVITNGNL